MLRQPPAPFTGIEIMNAACAVRRIVDELTNEVIDGHGRLLEQLAARHRVGRGEHAGTDDDWGTWGPGDFYAAAVEEVLDAVIYKAQQQRRWEATS